MIYFLGIQDHTDLGYNHPHQVVVVWNGKDWSNWASAKEFLEGHLFPLGLARWKTHKHDEETRLIIKSTKVLGTGEVAQVRKVCFKDLDDLMMFKLRFG